MHMISKNSKRSCEISPNSLHFFFFRGCGIKTEQVLRTQLHCIKSGCSEQLTECGGRESQRERERETEGLIWLFKHLTKHKSPLMCMCEMCQKGRGDERVAQEKLAAGKTNNPRGDVGMDIVRQL